MSVSCDIKFDENPSGVYFPGQTLSGTVELRLTEVTKIKGVSLQIKGLAQVLWSETYGSGKFRITIIYHGRVDYINSTTYLVGTGEGGNFELPAGIHLYRFSCELPQNCVTSIEAECGHVRYTAKVVLERSWKLNQSYKVAFTVLRHVNLNEERFDIQLPAKMHQDKTFCCGPCRSKPMQISGQIPISGYVPGQTVLVKLQVNNQSNKNLKEISTKLVRVVSLISQQPFRKVKEVTSVVAEVRCSGVDRRSDANYEQQLVIPPIAPTSNTCEVLTVHYGIVIEGKVQGLSINPKVKIPIVIGTVPLSASAVPAFGDVVNATLVVEQPTPGASSSSIELPPPSYEEAVNANPINIQEEGETNDIGWRDYTPRYTVYRFDAPLSKETNDADSNAMSLKEKLHCENKL